MISKDYSMIGAGITAAPPGSIIQSEVNDRTVVELQDSETSPTHSKPPNTSAVTSRAWMMITCCAVMMTGLGIFLYAGWMSGSLSGAVLFAIPAVLCLGIHAALHRVMHRSYTTTQNSQENDQ